jgi:hypothetical protein
MATLSITRKTSNALITASGFNTNYDEIEAVVNALTAANFAADSVQAVALNSDVVRTDYGLIQHTDGSLYVDLSDTNPSLELTDGGLRAKVVDGILNRNAAGLDFGASGDMILSARTGTPTGWTDVSATYANKMIRISATALSTGGSDTFTLSTANLPAHSHTVYGYDGSASVGTALISTAAAGNRSATSTGDTGSGTAVSNVPCYVTSRLLKKD